MNKRTKPALHICECATCQQHPYSRVAKDHKAINQVLTGLDERNQRRFVGLLANQQGNISLLSEITGLSRNTIYRGQSEVENPSKNLVLVGARRPGGGRTLVEKNNPGY